MWQDELQKHTAAAMGKMCSELYIINYIHKFEKVFLVFVES